MPKKNYLCIQRSPKSDGQAKSEAPSPADMEKMYARFNEWKEKFADNILDMGGKLGEGSVATSQGSTDGPFVETKEIAGGYMIVTADSLAEAVDVAANSPGVWAPGSSVEVREIHTP